MRISCGGLIFRLAESTLALLNLNLHEPNGCSGQPAKAARTSSDEAVRSS
jgi:hypothetical protein